MEHNDLLILLCAEKCEYLFKVGCVCNGINILYQCLTYFQKLSIFVNRLSQHLFSFVQWKPDKRELSDRNFTSGNVPQCHSLRVGLHLRGISLDGFRKGEALERHVRLKNVPEIEYKNQRIISRETAGQTQTLIKLIRTDNGGDSCQLWIAFRHRPESEN